MCGPQAGGAVAEQVAEYIPGLRGALGPEEDPGHEHLQQDNAVPQDAGNAFVPGPAQALNGQEEGMAGAPQQKGGVGPVPEAGNQHDRPERADGAQAPAAAAAERNVEVVAKPLRERDVPAGPELAQGDGQVGMVEVHLEVQPHPLGQPAGNLAVAAEVEVDLE